MKDLKKLQEMDRKMRELAGLYAAEKERADALEAELRALRGTSNESLQVGNAAKCKKLLGEVYGLLDKSKSYIIDVESIDRRREFSHYLTRAKNLVDNIISQELSANVSVGNAAKMREALKYLRDASREFCHLMRNSKYVRVMDEYKYAEVAKIIDAIANAGVTLSAPARNCDVYRTKKERDAAYKKYREYVIMSNSNPFVAQDEMMSKEEWLFAEVERELEKEVCCEA